MANASNEWRTLVRCQKPLEMHLQRRKRAELEDFRVRLKKMRARMPRTQFSRPGVKRGPPTVCSLCIVLVISLSIFGNRTPRTSTPLPACSLTCFPKV
uniref:Uncharacterized protein n=1 Tax=Cucumis melo TaxID=3656 RepID=A0A9I9E2U3_CUCME